MSIDTIASLAANTTRALTAHYGSGEAAWLTRVIFERLKGWNRTDLILKGDRSTTPWLVDEVNRITKRLLANEPIQYIFGIARFYGMDFKVTPATLIPRHDTEGLIDLIINRYSQRENLHVLDACTGSGCIAIALSRNLRFAEIDAFDISTQALQVATDNAIALHAKVNFYEANALALPSHAEPQYDIIVSNPPYIADCEKKSIDKNVLDYEPHSALFVPDDDPLKFYRAIAQYAFGALKPGGRLYFEINPIYADNLREMLRNIGFNDIILTRADNKLMRYAEAVL